MSTFCAARRLRLVRIFGALAATAAVIGCVNAGRPEDTQTEPSVRTAARSSEPADAANAAPTPSTGPQSASPSARDVCALLTGNEITQITGVPIERVERTPNGCEWYPNAAAQQQKGIDNARSTFEKLQKEEPKSAQEGVRTMENLFKGLGGAVAPSKPLFAATVHWEDGDQAEAMLKGTVAVNAGVPGGALEPVQGLGERAFSGAMGMLLYVRKGPALAMFGAMGITREEEIALARALVSKL